MVVVVMLISTEQSQAEGDAHCLHIEHNKTKPNFKLRINMTFSSFLV